MQQGVFGQQQGRRPGERKKKNCLFWKSLAGRWLCMDIPYSLVQRGRRITLAIALCLLPTIARAQPITTDGTTNTQINLDDSTFVIEQGTRVGENLFHSFSEFSLL
ncbi:MAG: filamentous hemagglutinin N-terminal domain-containing protein, partial [Symploca sp. SIO1B1]|nr:filamentous hemagglutinin N-terminal domain-containing protein [Symploca sp. SIO1B1]